ncbi:MAG: hypothetical protein OHK93_004933 [Ramalina farinacea]|uniref:Uncharacterized protein n=1 Tax=Ramalina farinacea TaxID=258253 RepID=A0AA43QV13_9LECA|nr:hypothetical protein [Ramalina farinacea]
MKEIATLALIYGRKLRGESLKPGWTDASMSDAESIVISDAASEEVAGYPTIPQKRKYAHVSHLQPGRTSRAINKQAVPRTGDLLASEAGHEALPTKEVSSDDRLFNFIRFEVANNDLNRSSHFFNMTSARTAM